MHFTFYSFRSNARSPRKTVRPPCIPFVSKDTQYTSGTRHKMAVKVNNNCADYIEFTKALYKTNNECFFHSCNGKNILIR